MRYIESLILLIMLTGLTPNQSAAFSIESKLESPEKEQRAINLFREIRCLVCISQSIADSETELARDLRGQIRKKINNGQTDEDIKTFLASRYGDQVLLAPPVNQNTYVLWFTPFVFLIIGLVLLLPFIRNRV